MPRHKFSPKTGGKGAQISLKLKTYFGQDLPALNLILQGIGEIGYRRLAQRNTAVVGRQVEVEDGRQSPGPKPDDHLPEQAPVLEDAPAQSSLADAGFAGKIQAD